MEIIKSILSSLIAKHFTCKWIPIIQLEYAIVRLYMT